MGMSLLGDQSATVSEAKHASYRRLVPQQAWVQSGTIRDNITFSSGNGEVDVDRVNEIIDACALRPDVDMWPDGDL